MSFPESPELPTIPTFCTRQSAAATAPTRPVVSPMTLPPSAAQHRSFAEDLLVGDIATTCDSFGMHHEGGTELSHNASQEQLMPFQLIG